MERANLYWQAREANDHQTVYELESAAEPRGWLTPFGAARIGTGIRLSDVEVSEPKIEGDNAEIKVEAYVRYMSMVNVGSGAFHQSLRDYWTKIDGKWYHKTNKVQSLADIAEQRKKAREQKDGTGEQVQQAQQAPTEAGESKQE